MQIAASQTTKQCPFCAETILVAARKCRYCGEFLNTERAKAFMAEEQDSESENPGEALFAGRPTLWAMTAAFFKGFIFLAIAIVLMVVAQKAPEAGKYLFLAGLFLALIVAAVLFGKALQIRKTSYTVSADRIEYGCGVFSHRIDNLDMFRVVDIKLHRSFFDCITGVGTVILKTTDKSHPEFVFKKVRRCRQLYDIIKKFSLSADRKTNVIHME